MQCSQFANSNEQDELDDMEIFDSSLLLKVMILNQVGHERQRMDANSYNISIEHQNGRDGT